MKKNTLIIVFGLSALLGFSQDYKQEVGLRGGYPAGISYKCFSNELNAYELIISYRQGGFQLTGLIEKYNYLHLRHFDNLYFYSGIGAHIGYTTKSRDRFFDNYIVKHYEYDERFRPVVGMDGIFGIEYRFEYIPLNLSLDFTPYFELMGEPFFDVSIFNTCLSVKYKFN